MSDYARLQIKVTPGSSRRKIIVDGENNIRVYLNSPPQDGRANRECIELFSKILRIAKSKISIEKGLHGKNKGILIEELTYNEIIKKLKQDK